MLTVDTGLDCVESGYSTTLVYSIEDCQRHVLTRDIFSSI